MKNKFDFIINDDKQFYRTIFRFYPKNTHVHSFNDKAPQNWKEVYKVYYSWAIIRQYYKDDGKNIEPSESERLLYFHCDECSKIPNLSEIIKYVVETGETYDYPTIGQPAADWEIIKINNFNEDESDYYKFQVFNNWTDQGFKFFLTKEQALDFCNYLDCINQYALEHGEPI